MRGYKRLVSLFLLLIMVCSISAVLSESEVEGPQIVPLDESSFIDLNQLEVLIGTTNADKVDIFTEPDGIVVTTIAQAGTLVCVFAADDPLEPVWYQVAVEAGEYVYSGFVEAGAITVSPVTDAENMLGSEAYALALNKLYEVSELEPEQLPEGLYELILAAQPVYLSKTGSKYHSIPTCSNMKNPRETTLRSALSAGKEPCKNCVKPSNP
ncbi:hypothetical protein FACS1894184_18550 [Clostridia bacterium]|nr:hypothetical protein FACS1894184_18550 [Clostridia bacterium]